MSTHELVLKAGFKHCWFFYWAWDFIPCINRLIKLVKETQLPKKSPV